MKSRKRSWRSIEQSAEWAKAEGIKTVKGWNARIKLTHPSDIPSCPALAYLDFYKRGGWGWSLGTGFIACSKRIFWPAEKSFAWASSQGLHSRSEWSRRCSTDPHFRPADVPIEPHHKYGADFERLGGWKAFLGPSFAPHRKRHYAPYLEARAWARSSDLATPAAWAKAWSNTKSANFPHNPELYYGDEFEEGGGWSGFLGVSQSSLDSIAYRSLDSCAEWAQSEGIASATVWRSTYSRPNSSRPRDIPGQPDKHFKGEFQARGGWGWFLGTGNIANFRKVFLSLDEARAWAIEQNFSSSRDWQKRIKVPGFRPLDVPSDPNNTYGSAFLQRGGWSWFLGLTKLVHTSRSEIGLRKVLCQMLNVSPSTSPIVCLSNGKRLHCDFVDRSHKLIVEYDGYWYHRNREIHDSLKTAKILADDPSWKLIRVREKGLSKLDDTFDAIVDPNGLYSVRALAVAKHLDKLIKSGHIQVTEKTRSKISQAIITGFDEAQFSDLKALGYRPFAQAVAWAQSLGLSSRAQWVKATRTLGFYPMTFRAALMEPTPNLLHVAGGAIG